MAVSISISITQNSQNITNNTSNVTAKVTAKWTGGSYNQLKKSGYLKIDGTQYDFTSAFNSSKTTSGTGTLFTKTVDVKHNSDGTKNLECSASYTSGVSSGTVKASASKTLTTIPRKSTLSVANGTLNTAQTLTVTRASTSFTHTITYKCGTATGTICTKSTSTSVSFTPPLSLASQNTTGTSVSITYTITTYNGDASLGSNTYTKTLSIPTSVVPTCALTIEDATGYSSTYGGYIQGVSKFKVTVTGTQAYNSPIASYSTTANGSTYTSATFTTDVIKNSGKNTITGKVTDKRGRSGTKSTDITVLAYSKPKITKLSVGRCNQDGSTNEQGDYVKVTYSCNITSLSSKNTLTSVVKYKKTTDKTFTSKTDLSAVTTASYTDRAIIFAADSESSYDIELTLTDKFGSVVQSTSVSTAFTFQHVKGPNVDGEGKNKVPTTINYWEAGHYFTDGTKQDYASRIRVIDLIPVEPNTTYYFNTFNDNYQLILRTYDKNKSFLTSNGGIANGSTITNSANVRYYGISIFNPNSGGITFEQYTTLFQNGSIKPFICLNSETDKSFEEYITNFAASMGLGKIAELEGGLDIGFKTRHSGGIKQPILKEGTDLNTVMTANTYTGENIMHYQYTNAPVSDGTFTLTVEEAGPAGQVKQIFEECNKANGAIWERFYHSSSWGEWTCIAHNKINIVDETVNVGLPINSHVYFKTSKFLAATKPSTSKDVVILELQNGSGNTTLGYGNYKAKSGATNIYGYDVGIGIANVASGAAFFRPYYRKGDTINVQINAAGYTTNSKLDVRFMVPLDKPIIGNPTITVASNNGLTVRQDGNYCYGSSASVAVTPNSYTANIYPSGVNIIARFTTATGTITNNSGCGVYWDGKIILS